MADQFAFPEMGGTEPAEDPFAEPAGESPLDLGAEDAVEEELDPAVADLGAFFDLKDDGLLALQRAIDARCTALKGDDYAAPDASAAPAAEAPPFEF